MKAQNSMTSVQPPADVQADVVTTLVVPDGPGLPVPVRMSFWRSDPFAVHLGFDTGDHALVTWTFARELLDKGTREPTGLGDVQVTPATPEGRRLVVGLSSPTGQATFELDRSAVQNFLGATFALVPAGHESDQLDVDAELESVLAGNG